LRVLHVVSSTAFAGIERHVLTLSRGLTALGCVAELACPPGATRLREEATRAGIRVVPRRRARSGSWAVAAAHEVLVDSPHVVHVHDGRSAIAAALVSSMTPAKLVRTQHFARPASLDRAGFARHASLTLHRRVNARLDGYTAVSQCVADGAVQRCEAERAKVVVIPPAIVLPGADATAAARASRAGLHRPVVVFAGRLDAERRLDVLLRAIPELRAAVPGCHLMLAGAGAAETDLRALARELGVEGSVTWPGWVTEPYLLMGQAHVYVNTWPWEGFGMATAEAMGLALPVVAVDSGASSEMVDPGITGFLVPPGDAPALSAALSRVLLDPDRAAEMGEAGRRRALALYGVQRTARDTLALYRRVCAEPA
jgi:glycosyltransferase involved in cell wall biosynthesis